MTYLSICRHEIQRVNIDTVCKYLLEKWRGSMWERFCEYIALFLMYFFSSFCLLLLSYDLSKVAVEIHLPHVDEIQFSSVAQLCPALRSHGLQHTRLPYPSPTSGAYSNSCPSSWWCHPTISSSVILFSPCLQSFPESFPLSQFFVSGGQSIGVSASTSVLPTNIQDCFPFGWTGWISLQSKGLSRVFSNIRVQKHQFFGAQLFL